MIIQAEHLGGMQFELVSPENTLVADQWEEFGGDGAGPMPGEYMLCAIASCFGQAIMFVAKRMRKDLAALRLEVDGVKDMKLFRLSSVTIRVMSDSSLEVLQKVVKTAKKYCFVTNSLSKVIKFEVIVEEE